jgi:hypothetical protein
LPADRVISCLVPADPKARLSNGREVARLHGVEPVVLLLVAIALPTVAGLVAIAAVRVGRQLAERERGPVPLGPPIEQIAADLRRLNHQRRQQVGQGPAPGRGVRTRALTAAYVDVLTTACEVLEVVPPQLRSDGRVTRGEIGRVEAELRGRGLDVEPG